MVLSLCNLPSKNISPSLIIEKNIKQIPLEEYFTEYVTNAPQNCKNHQKQEKSEELSQPSGSKETR